jgi:CDP-glucose 4,6-dehydratase
MGTVYLLDAIRNINSVRAVVNVTTDKVYDNKEWEWGYRESEPFGGYDPYSNSKACSELVTSAYRNSFFNPADYSKHNVALASARAGNVIGGGDWALDRIVPDCISALSNGESILIRNPNSIRPWQHVLEPLGGYLLLAELLFTKGIAFTDGWNFGPEDSDCVPVETLVKKLCDLWGENSKYEIVNNNSPHEANFLKLDCSKAKRKMLWNCRWNLDDTLKSIVTWSKGYENGQDVQLLCIEQINKWQIAKL